MDRSLWARRTLVITSVVIFAVIVVFALAQLASVLLLFFAGIVLAAFLRAIAAWIARHTPASTNVALALTVLGLVGVIAGVSILLAPRIAEQANGLAGQVSELWAQARQLSHDHSLVHRLALQLRSESGQAATRVLGFFSNALGAVGSLAVIVFVGLYLAISPQTYLSGALRLIPVGSRERARTIAEEAGTVLQRWVLGRILACTIVGIGTSLGIWAIGSPFALSLGVVAGVLSFVPNFGPAISVLPAIAVNLPQGLTQVVLVCAVYAGVQAVESFIITPQIQKRAVSVPPVLLLFAQTCMGILAGLVGIVLATPLLACLILVVDRLYVQSTLEARKESAE